jgi:pimeloyl-ACP methyl ester carboxylesterase
MEDFNRLLANFIDSLGFQRVVLLGHSFGGFVINNFAQYYHDKICGYFL